MLIVVVNEPIHRGIDRHIDLCIVQRCNTGQHNGRTVGLHCRTCIKVINILYEYTHRDFLICVIAGQINAHQGHKLDFRVFLHILQHVFLSRIGGNYIQQFIHFDILLSKKRTGSKKATPAEASIP